MVAHCLHAAAPCTSLPQRVVPAEVARQVAQRWQGLVRLPRDVVGALTTYFARERPARVAGGFLAEASDGTDYSQAAAQGRRRPGGKGCPSPLRPAQR
jgi:hypothetical protein